MTEPHRPRHALDEDPAFAVPAEAPETTEPSPGLPLRGLAMVLLAVGALLAAWGAFSFFGGSDGDQSTNAAQSAATSSARISTVPSAPPAPSSAAAQPSGSQQPPSPSSEPPRDGGAAAGSGTGNQGAQVDRARTYVTVLNNSPVQGLAGDTAGKLRGRQWANTGVGNLPDTQYRFPRSVVLYPAGDANARAAAESVASDLGLPAEQRTPEIDRSLGGARMQQGPNPGAVVVVTTNDLGR
ncbi:LytR C-terminal domain-containing protein [Corynebacterium heidelbergense]|uniref:LytR/CpsA/Psr regulator C-terminal domain-containing protein n=1 Tax=Corynebacterium heidelbergense TaxID=2055947 RepID=A0A364V6L1_9CORY|nr:LytR C-terminal domain-containing protein [Corynebacterium heidelbergense]RAV32300.1 hypothetical protein DLJ54_03900 [Corynebacterium heidelbergense]